MIKRRVHHARRFGVWNPYRRFQSEVAKVTYRKVGGGIGKASWWDSNSETTADDFDRLGKIRYIAAYATAKHGV